MVVTRLPYTIKSTMAGVCLCQLIATVPTGLEGGAADEIQETLGRRAEANRGKINFEIVSFEQLKLVTKRMDTCDDLYLSSISNNPVGGQTEVC